jgi:hypothetical protein
VIAPPVPAGGKPTFVEELRLQRWDDHRYYHQSRVNQSLHLLSAMCFCATYVGLFFEPAFVAIVGWIVPMWVRQIGHFFFEPKGYDHVNGATFEHKEDIKLGYNLKRKVVLLAVWLVIPLLVWIYPGLFGTLTTASGVEGWIERTGFAWLLLAIIGLLGRTLYLVATRGTQTGFVWCTKILTDPLHDIRIYHRAPLHLLKGERFDPMSHVAIHPSQVA